MERYNSSTPVTNTFSYDAQNRLLTAYGKQYNYDPVGRMLKYEATSNNQTFNNNFPINALKNTGYLYDANGNLTQRPTGTITQTLVWDSENHLSQVKNGSTVLESYTYDTDGNRVKKTVGSTSFYYPFAHYEISGTTPIKYYFFGGQRVAMKVGSTLTYLHGDHLGSTVLETNASGAVATDEKYFAFGKQRDSGKVATDHRFTGQKEDGSGLMYYGARFFDPLTGMFVSPDTMVPDSGKVFAYNRTMYVYGNPMANVDPTGHLCVPLVNVGNTCTEPTNWDAIQASLDVAGVADPTPISDGANAVISLARGNYTDAGLSAVAMVPYIGDLAKGSKYADEAYAAGKWAVKKGANLLGLSDEAAVGAAKVIDCLTNSFSADTLVMTARGLRPISELIEGDLVLAWDEATGKQGYFVVTDTISHVDPQIVLLTIDDETLETTAEHPFYVVEVNEWSSYLSVGKWIDAGALQVGDEVLQADGTTGEVRSVRVVVVTQPMYNLTVNQAHTFFVGQGQWLVHNAGCAVKFDMKQVQSKFNDHAEAFGVTGNWNPANGAKFQQALEAHITGKNTVAIQGVYNRGASKMNVTHYFDPTTGLNVIADQNGNFISGWKLNPDQIKNLLSTGILGGGN